MGVPNCPSCSEPLGLYYADCDNCFAHANDYALSEYDDAPEATR